VLPTFSLPLMVKWLEMLLILGRDDGSEARGLMELFVVATPTHALLVRHIDQVTRRSKLARQVTVNQAFIEIQWNRGVAPSRVGSLPGELAHLPR
jgi:hypothetical protein